DVVARAVPTARGCRASLPAGRCLWSRSLMYRPRMIPSVLLVAISILAQDPPPAPPPSAEQLTRAIEDATADLTRLAPKRSELPPESWHEAELRLTEAVNAFVARPANLEWEHVARGIQTTWRTQCPGACAMLCELGLQRFDPTAALHAQLGMCKMALA